MLDELVPSALHTVEQYANNPVEADHGRLKARLRPMRGLKRRRSARILAAGHAFVQNLRRGHYDIATDTPDCHRLHIAFDDLALTFSTNAASLSCVGVRGDGTTQQRPSTSSRWLSDQPIVPVSALHHAHQSANATLPPRSRLVAEFWNPTGVGQWVLLQLLPIHQGP